MSLISNLLCDVTWCSYCLHLLRYCYWLTGTLGTSAKEVMFVCLFKITRKVLNRLEWNFQEASLMGQTDVLVMFQITVLGRKSRCVGEKSSLCGALPAR